MLKSMSRWIVERLAHEDEAAAQRIAGALGLKPLAARLLVRRGLRDADAARAFLEGGPETLHDPFAMKGMREAAERVRLAVSRGDRIRIFGDYDADGVSSTALASLLLRELNAEFDHVVPHRTLEGYGLSVPAVEAAAAAGIGLILTVDNGISANEPIARAKELGIDVVVTDHHEPPPTLPEAAAIVNPKQPGCPYPFKGLAGVGVAFKLAHALLGRPPLEWTELAALGTIADLMPLVDENRFIVRHGLERLRRTDRPGLRALASVCGFDPVTATAESIAFGMAPRINAAGRLRHADPAIVLLLTSDESEAAACAAELDALNRERQRLVDRMVEQAEAIWADKVRAAEAAGKDKPGVIIAAAEGWNVGVAGIVASKLIERHYRPAIVFDIDPETGTAKGSARSIAGFDLHAALTACADLLDHYGGHQAAAGMTLQADRLPELEARLDGLAAEWLTAEDYIRKTEIDLVCAMDEATLAAAEQLKLLEPYGHGNPRPTLLIADVPVRSARTIGKDGRHLHITPQGPPGTTFEAVGFGLGEWAARISDTARVDLVGELNINEWNGRRKPQLLVRDLRVSNVQLFDGRVRRAGAGGTAGRLDRLMELGTRGIAAEPAAVFTADPALREAAAAGAADRAGAWIVRGYDDGDEALGECRSIVLIDPPPSEERLAAILEACREPAAVYALYEVQDAHDPDRSAFTAAYRLLRDTITEPVLPEEARALLGRKLAFPPELADLVLNVFGELGFIESEGSRIRLAMNPAKRSLEESAAYREAVRAAEARRFWSAPAAELAAWIERKAPACREFGQEPNIRLQPAGAAIPQGG
ncbi:single-stranded-DNA-specific exonuclease RecJ [Thermobacillus composti KWC4]|uniref:Single-stranded-DNA-specific exonuclease RecJ n=1 Tax=Thermobacillus composti (strain DSM 18247 / JCM 13945 / KWC4) TaxID=717605 RepID=L0EFZ9_THECK|nr:single-stranded-DNA-specific exonuclease RecJ [Thermobacillus composti]AGA58611.1 single-stranded-DNA-specific exonuclease RecJ [Thermobacillus composti KWC4]